MKNRIHRAFTTPVRENPSWDERWKGDDRGLITCWEIGRSKRGKEPDLAKKAAKGELPVLEWKGGVGRKIRGEKHGTLYYLAQWQGLRGEDLDIAFHKDVELTCSKTGQKVTYTGDPKKWT